VGLICGGARPASEQQIYDWKGGWVSDKCTGKKRTCGTMPRSGVRSANSRERSRNRNIEASSKEYKDRESLRPGCALTRLQPPCKHLRASFVEPTEGKISIRQVGK